MGERKYRQRGYQDSDRERREKRSDQRSGPKPETFGPKTPRMPATHSVVRCAGCGAILPPDFDLTGRCARCGFELHSCKQCAYFDTSAKFECTQPIPHRIAKKDSRNHCTFYAPRTTVERQTSPGGAPRSRSDDPRKAFEDLFKKQ
jgi:hypothetical protein